MAKFGVDPHGRWDKNLAQEQFKDHVDNIVKKYNEAGPEMVKGGHEWYNKAQGIAEKIGGGDVNKGAGIIAALSPMTSWERNISDANELTKTGNVKGALVPANVEKARRIHEGEEPEKVLGGNKVTSFYHNISDPSSPLHVTVDRHAHDIAIGNPFIGVGGKGGVPRTSNASGNKPMSEDLGLSAMGRYKHFVHAYTVASGALGVDLPHKVQATTWVQHRGAVG